MIALLVATAFSSIIWLLCAAYCAPLACEGPNGFCVTEPGDRLASLLPAKFAHTVRPQTWGLG